MKRKSGEYVVRLTEPQLRALEELCIHASGAIDPQEVGMDGITYAALSRAWSRLIAARQRGLQ